jgi:hypothetical protein
MNGSLPVLKNGIELKSAARVYVEQFKLFIFPVLAVPQAPDVRQQRLEKRHS